MEAICQLVLDVSSGEQVNSFDYPKEEWKKMNTKETTTFRCLVCDEPMRLRKGEKYRPHFAHFSNSECSGKKEEKKEVENPRENKEHVRDDNPEIVCKNNLPYYYNILFADVKLQWEIPNDDGEQEAIWEENNKRQEIWKQYKWCEKCNKWKSKVGECRCTKGLVQMCIFGCDDVGTIDGCNYINPCNQRKDSMIECSCEGGSMTCPYDGFHL